MSEKGLARLDGLVLSAQIIIRFRSCLRDGGGQEQENEARRHQQTSSTATSPTQILLRIFQTHSLFIAHISKTERIWLIWHQISQNQFWRRLSAQNSSSLTSIASSSESESSGFAKQRVRDTGKKCYAAVYQIILKEQWDSLTVEEQTNWNDRAELLAANISDPREYLLPILAVNWGTSEPEVLIKRQSQIFFKRERVSDATLQCELSIYMSDDSPGRLLPQTIDRVKQGVRSSLQPSTRGGFRVWFEYTVANIAGHMNHWLLAQTQVIPDDHEHLLGGIIACGCTTDLDLVSAKYIS
ncbi:hypothetical protein B0H14DRAFT_3170426 [Mycena olivaceomarginata]|nr:hypothetical protein B0H14DRAFT_3170426 [Mycena olivaceomarginata]